MTTPNDLDLSQGFDAGNYAAAYVTPSYEKAIARLSMNRSPAYHIAFTLGYFSSYTLEEMYPHTDTYLEAYMSPAGQQCVELGYIDALSPEELENAYT